MKKLWTMLLCIIGVTTFAQVNLAPDITKWTNVPGMQHIEQGAGIDGEPALVYERSNKEEYKFTSVPVPKMMPGKRYLVGVYVKTVGMPKTHGGATVAIEYGDSKRKYAGGVWPEGLTQAKDWTKVEAYVSLKEDAKVPTMLLYMRRGATGKAYFSRPYVYEAKPAFYSDIISPRQKYSMAPGKTDLVFGIFTEGLNVDGKSFTLNINKGNRFFATQNAKATRTRLVFKDLNFTPGDYSFTLKCNDIDLDEESNRFRVLPAGAKPEKGNHVTVDEAGRVILNGKPFMPIGMYANQTDKVEDFKIWKESGFNCMMPYNTIYWKRCEKAPSDPKARVTEMIKALDDLNAQGIKILFSVKDIHPGVWDTYGTLQGDVAIVDLLVNAVKYHPVVLGWYMNDEIEDNPFYRDFRYRVSTIDPYHPTFQVQCRVHTMGSTIGYSDVFMVDPYPFQNKPEDGCDLCRRFMEVANDVFGNAIIGVPQTFGWYQYRKDAKDTYFPTMQQMRGHTLLEAAMGAKGFFFYTYFSCKRHKDRTGIDRWPDILDLTKMLHSLEPFIMSLETAPTAAVTAKEGEVIAKSFAANGKVAVVISSIEGKTSAEVRIPGQPNLKSRYGLTKNLGEGRYLYEAAGCDGDILE
ncbi:MAG: hypothetical protein J6X55_00810 [Victivallales bacterium]|nr:hypothetical protein [Victivallales bacterium]